MVHVLKEQYGALGCGSRTHYSLPWVLLWIPDTEEDLASHSAALSADLLSSDGQRKPWTGLAVCGQPQ